MAVETVRKDFKEMLIHHVATIGLISLSHYFGFHRIGYVVLLIHDIGDIFLYSAKFFNYLKWNIITNILFGLFAIVFFAARLVAFPFVITTSWYATMGYVEGIDGNTIVGAPILPTLLTVLQVLHFMWFGLILRMVYRMLSNKESSQKDIRSDDEAEDMSDAATSGSKDKAIVGVRPKSRRQRESQKAK
jgi:ceramide synthetase